MRFTNSTVPILAAGLLASTLWMAPAHSFSIKDKEPVAEDMTDISNKKFERAALLEARAYICGTNEASDVIMRAGMRETGLPEDIAVEIVSDLASGIIDKAEASGSRAICGNAKVQLSSF
ncbi:hypothetical protein [Phyllobacterium lublinensis]|uniref:hypothetical protein n=1 Tax=Phyllobacterium lublinensis TaxID=2875708 RepID=UPI001CD01737|nr:hypothetical protein [Phyllobacterium sp. 2063]MBZ9656870.1 hypothetical protein [Phyllobacterium sp. 2063]